jgi:AraC family transcriptional regulator
MHPMIYEQKLLKLVGLKKDFAEMQPELASALWKKFLPRLNEIELSKGDSCYGVIVRHPTRIEYFCGVEVSATDKIPQGMHAMVVSPSTSAKFKHIGPIVTIGRTVHSIYHKWLPLCEWKRGEGPDLEIYPLDYDADSEKAVMEYAVPLRT